MNKLYNKTNSHKENPLFLKIIYIIKQYIRIYIPYSRSNGWTEWADFFVDTHGYSGGSARGHVGSFR